MRYWFLAIIALICVAPAHAVKITVVTENNAPYQELINGEVGGVATEVIKEVLGEAVIEYEMNLYPWARAYKMAQVQENVLIYSVARSAARENLFTWLEEIVPFSVYMYKLKGSDINITTLEEAKAFQVGVVTKGFRHEFFLDNGFVEGINLTSITRDEQNMQKLLLGRIDLMPFDELGFQSKARAAGIDAGRFVKLFKIKAMSTSLYAACSKQTSPEIIHRLKAAFKQVKDDGRYQAIIDKYLGDGVRP